MYCLLLIQNLHSAYIQKDYEIAYKIKYNKRGQFNTNKSKANLTQSHFVRDLNSYELGVTLITDSIKTTFVLLFPLGGELRGMNCKSSASLVWKLRELN